MSDVRGLYARFAVTVRPAADHPDGWATVRCFTGTHPDRHPSCRVHMRTGGFRCFTCGARGGVLAALELLGVRDPAERVRLAVDYGILDRPIRPKPRPAGLSPARPSPPPPGKASRAELVDYDNLAQPATGARERSWTYQDADGEPVGRVRRLDLPDGKRVWQERPDGAGGWLPGLNGALLPLYRLPDVLARAAAGERVLVVEGEKACDALDRLGVFATTSPGGAGKWRSVHTGQVAGATVVAVCDCDLAGRQHAIDVTHACLTAGVRALMPLDLAELRGDGYDVVDWLTDIADTVRAVEPCITAAELRDRLARRIERELARCLPADGRALQLLAERARFRHDPNGSTLVTCDRCGHERPHHVTHGLAYCPCGAHQAAP